MSLTITNRQPAGITTGGQFAPTTKRESTVGLGDGYPSTLPPTAEQVARATAEADRRIAVDPAKPDVSPEERDALIASLATRMAENEAAYEAWKRGEPHEDDEAYAAIWSGETDGFGRAFVELELEVTRKMRHDLDTGAVKPRHVIGTGYKPGVSRRLAEEWLDGSISQYEEALRCDGRNLSVNQSNVFSRKRRAAAEAAF